LRRKLTRALLLVMGSTGLATLAIVVITSAQASSEHLRSVQRYIEQGITSKGKVLTENHARALRGLTLDNAFLDIQHLVERVVQEDADLVYGLYVNPDGATLAFSRRGELASGDKPMARDAWRAMQIPEQELLVKAETIKRVTRGGEDLLEVAVPVSGEAGEVLGTIRYGLSTRPMQTALALARSDARARLLRSVLWLASLVTGSTLLGLLLSRSYAVRITRPVAELTAAAEARATGNRAVWVTIDSGDEIGLLGASFNRMGEDLDASYRELEKLNQGLEQKVAERTIQLAGKNRDLQLVLDNVGQGFITLDIDGVMSPERSRVVDRWFGSPDGCPKFCDYLARIDASLAAWFNLGWVALLEDVMPMAVTLEQLPALIRKDSATFELAYRPILDGARLTKLIVVITDVTARIERERAEQAQREMMSIFRHTLADRTALDAFFIETGALVESASSAEDPDPVCVRRQIHTIKGNAALFDIESVASLCDRLEDRMNESGVMSRNDRDALRATWTKILQMRARLADRASDGGVELDPREYEAFAADLRRHLPHDVLTTTVASWRFEPATKRLELIGEQIRLLAKRLGRAPVDVVFEPTRLRLPQQKWRTFWSAFTHVVRNTVDHGIETVEQRTEAGKTSNATVTVSIGRDADEVVVTIADDGPGINWAAIAARAAQHKLPHATTAALEQALFADGISSRNEVTSMSGRGVGLSAVRDAVLALGGRAEVRSEEARGTTFRFLLPPSVLFEDPPHPTPADPSERARHDLPGPKAAKPSRTVSRETDS
jgi:two-component system chemotaxis sensor kinase CheA